MFIYPNKHKEVGLSHNPFKAIVSPRPIGWISTCCSDGTLNLAPYSFFNAVSEQPPMVMFCSAPKKEKSNYKDSLTNIKETGEFVVNIVSYALRDKMNISSKNYPKGVSEFEMADIDLAPSQTVKVPHVKFAPASLECNLWQIVELPPRSDNLSTSMILGFVTGINLDESIIKDGKIDVTIYEPISRLGYSDYAKITELFSMPRPE